MFINVVFFSVSYMSAYKSILCVFFGIFSQFLLYVYKSILWYFIFPQFLIYLHINVFCLYFCYFSQFLIYVYML